MFKKSQGKIEGHGGVQLFVQAWIKPQALGTIIITHGQGEHSDCYDRVIHHFENGHWNFVAWDLRGHGKSEGRRGYAAEFEDYVRDFEKVLEFVFSQSQYNHGMTVLLSHSMGGLVQLKTLLENPHLKITAQICSAPLLGVAVKVPLVKDLGAEVINKLIPQLTLHNEIANTDLTRDTDVLKEFVKDPFRHHRISSGVYLGFKENFPLVLERAHEIKIPTLFQLAGKDVIVSTPAAQEVYQQLGSENKTLHIYEESKHEIYNDLDRKTAFEDMDKFLYQFKT